ncbi:Multisubunit Na+/H+ antiporter, MnhC subunit [Halobiforma haloterrestris]|uniref:Multisubunit Na+/H+ antiporter, MnhC subunit n=1 Tax=Natronobacterium haloterrestre TaxID=148448 RepID=A0A1I1JUX9_NATHA|nr:DUF4129 domain-containing protein [Halobiforma haloterrestris]SFC50288.1 Multisubunit Na+/H+ antiporter, MnhC subunit [Halobiforma haloterrestris]
MPRNRRPLLVRLVAAVAGIVAIGLAAATVESPVEIGGSGGIGSTEGQSSPGGIEPPPQQEPPVEHVEVPAFLEYLIAALLVLAAVIVVWYLLTHRRDALRVLALSLVVMLAVYLFIRYADPIFPSSMAPGGEPLEGSSGDGFSEDGDGTPAVEPLLAALAVLTAIVLGGLLLSRRDGETDAAAAETPDGEDERPGQHVAAVGNAAGRAADRIESTTDVDNEIYRAWREMTSPLEVDRPDASTPREFAAAAVDAGLERNHVEELTKLFEDVRYGSAEATPEREQRAKSVLRRIEAAYAEGGSVSESGDSVSESGDGTGPGTDGRWGSER